MVGEQSPTISVSRSIMPVKYKILSSHADAKPKAGTKTSNYPKGKGKSKSKMSKKKMY
jgi:hypothetical protein